MKQITWEVRLSAAPSVLFYCKKCGSKTEHLCAGKFRVNAQRQTIDVWLIYNCHICKNTRNLPVLSRVHKKSIGQKALERFMQNDSVLALRCASDVRLIKKAGGSTLGSAFTVFGEDVIPSYSARITITGDEQISIKLAAILRAKLDISGNELKKYIEDGTIRQEDGTGIGQQRLGKKAVVLIGNKQDAKPFVLPPPCKPYVPLHKLYMPPNKKLCAISGAIYQRKKKNSRLPNIRC